MSLRILTIGISFGVMVCGCATTTPLPQIPCPPRPLLHSITQEQRDTIDDEIYDVLAGNQIKLKGYVKKLEKRASCEAP